MSSLLFKNDIHNILPVTSTENNVKPINNIKIISKTNDDFSVTSSAFMNNINLNTATSSANVSQMIGGDYTNSVTSDLNSDINNLVNMLTSDSHMNNINNTSNQSLENKLRKLLNQDGGDFDDNINTDELENKIYNVIKNNKQNNKQEGGSNLVKLGLAATGAYFAYNMIKPSETETEINVNKILNKGVKVPVLSPTSHVLAKTSPVLAPTSPVLAKTSPVLAPTSPVLSATSPVLSATSPVLSTTSPVLSTTSPVLSANSSVRFPKKNVESTKQIVPKKNVASTKQIVSNNSKVVTPKVVTPKVATPQVPVQKQNDSEVSENVFIKSSKQINKVPQILTTTDVPISTTSSFMPVDSRVAQLEMTGGNNPALVAFRTIVKNISTKLEIKYNKALKVASKLQADVKSKNPNISHEELADAAKKLLEQKMNEYKEFAKTI